MMLMNRLKKIPLRVFLRYLLMMLPGTAALALVLVLARQWLGISTGLFVLIVSLSVIKDLVVFPFVWEAYDTTRPGISGVLTGARGIVVEPLSPVGRIKVKGENWRAECIDCKIIEKGVPVRVVRRKGLTLFVETI